MKLPTLKLLERALAQATACRCGACAELRPLLEAEIDAITEASAPRPWGPWAGLGAPAPVALVEPPLVEVLASDEPADVPASPPHEGLYFHAHWHTHSDPSGWGHHHHNHLHGHHHPRRGEHHHDPAESFHA